MDWKSTLVSLAVSAVCAVGAWVGVHISTWLKSKATNELTKGAVLAAQEVVGSLVAHAETTLRPAIVAAASNALANGKLSPTDGANLKQAVMTMLKASYPDVIADLEKALGLTSGSSLEVYLSGLIERSLGAQRAAGTLPVPAPAADPIATKIGQAAAALTASTLKVTPAATLPASP
jgi:hypothetical protein